MIVAVQTATQNHNREINPEASRQAGQCVARATPELCRGLGPPEVFRKLTGKNGMRVFRIQFKADRNAGMQRLTL